MNWGKIYNKRRITRRYGYWQSIYKLRQDLASAAMVPEEYILGTNVEVSTGTLDEIKEMNKIFIEFWNLQTRGLPRKLKKRYRKICRNIKWL